MASRPVLLLGNVASILLTIIAFLQVLSWTIAGLLILATLTITTVAPTSLRNGTTHPGPKRSTNHPAALDTKNHRDRSVEKPSTHTHIASAKLEAKATTKFEPSKTFGSQTKPEPPKIVPPKVNTVKVNPPIVTPPKSIPNTVSPSKNLPAKFNPPNISPLRPIPPTLTPTKPSPIKSGQPTSMQNPSEFKPESTRIQLSRRVITQATISTWMRE